VIAEELGFVFCIILIGLFLCFLWRGIKISRSANDEYGKLVAIGITAWIVGQAFLNIGAMTKILPLTGVPLPLMSSGGTSLVVTLMALGILFNISKSSRV
ncbi:MAG: FtsW/RodA/SpoVE family cell cycle protein, partial [Candidatus Komeilibacteria bacterium]|nr:FtsW/RodA/SpoVE family cell cycle protein [Candidatus Komeilibacteria bacterium]